MMFCYVYEQIQSSIITFDLNNKNLITVTIATAFKSLYTPKIIFLFLYTLLFKLLLSLNRRETEK